MTPDDVEQLLDEAARNRADETTLADIAQIEVQPTND